MKEKLLFTGLIFLLSITKPAFGSVIASSTFDFDMNGWTGVAGESTFITHAPSGGNPGGYIRNEDRGTTGGHIVAPADYLGDWTTLDGTGKLTWDFKLIVRGLGDIVPLRAYISGPGGAATFDSGILTPIGIWVSVIAPIDETLWTMDTGDWASLVGNITELKLNIENVRTTNGFETTGIDNVTLSAVPIPGAAWLLGSGITGLVAMRRKKKK